MSLSWIVIALLVVSLYFVNYHQPGHHPSIFFIFLHPVDGLKYFLSLISAIVPIGYLSILGTIVLGSLLLAFYFYAILRVFKLRGNSVFYLPILLIFFSLFFDIITTVGRSGFGIGFAFGSSRYTTFNILGVIGIYLSLLTIIEVVQKQKFEEKEGQLELKRNKIFSAKSNYGTVSIKVKKRANKIDSICLIILLLIFLLQISLSYPYGLESGENIKTQRTEDAYTLLNYEIAADNTIERTLYPNVKRLKELASICKEYKLNVFSDPPNYAYFPANLTLSSEPGLCDISLNGISINQQKQPLVINAAKEKEIVTGGWAVDKEASDIASAVFITIDDELDIPTIYGIDRNDVSKYYKNVKYRYSGYRASFSTSIIEAGEHKLGTAGDIPLIGDFNKDGKGDMAIFNNGLWSVDTTRDLVADLIFAYGSAGDIPLVGDFNKDGADDIAIFRKGLWCVATTGDHVSDLVFGYGIAGDIPLVGDINKDGRDDTAVFRNGMWYVDTNMDQIADLVFAYRNAGDIPLVGDINKDGRDDTAVFKNGMWCVDTNMDQMADLVFSYGIAGDVPLLGTSDKVNQSKS
jgi:putative lipoic acid-binding regulatory protein